MTLKICIKVFWFVKLINLIGGYQSLGEEYRLHLQSTIPLCMTIHSKMTAFWATAPCSLVEVDRFFISAY
jgi:hypothetical protein